MPPKKGNGKKKFEEGVRELMKSGYPQRLALAIANEKKRVKK